MTRIRSDNVQVGGSFVVPIEQKLNLSKIKEALAKEEEIILNAENRAKKIIEEAEIQAQDIIQKAQAQALAEIDEINAQGHKEGFEAGFKEGFDKITDELSEKVLSVDDFSKSQFEIKRAILKSAHADIINLVIAIADKICSKSLELNDEILKEITQNAIMSLKDKENINIIVNPDMAERIYSISEELKDKIPQLQSIKIIEDNSVSPDGTIVESPLSRVDCRIKSQIDELAEKLFNALNSTSDEELIQEIEE